MKPDDPTPLDVTPSFPTKTAVSDGARPDPSSDRPGLLSPFLPSIPGYTLIEEIAHGGMGVVYRGEQAGLKRPAAIKIMHGWIRHEPTARMRFAIEAEAVAQLKHPHVVSVYEFGEHDGVPFLAMEYLDGGSLAEKLRRDGRFTPHAAAEVLAAIAEAVAAAHARGIVHRDLKPSNVMLTAAGVPKVTDFGLARIGTGELTTSGMMIGTPNYMSPEQAEGRVREIGTPADVWALGCILYRLLTNRLPFDGDSVTTTYHQVLECEPPSLHALAPDLPRDLETICLKCLEKEPRKRYPTADALASDLRAFLDGRPIAARPITLAERGWKWAKRYPGRAAAVGVMLLAVVAIGVAAAGVRSALADERERASHGQRVARAEAAADALITAESVAVPPLVEGMDDFRPLALPRLRELAAKPISTNSGLHARFALLPDEPHRITELLDYARTCRADELALFTRLPIAATVEHAPALWADLTDPRTAAPKRLRIAAVLAAVAPTDPRWTPHAPTLADQLVRVTPLEAEAFVRAFTPIRETLLPELRKLYAAAILRVESGELARQAVLSEFGPYELTAQLLARWSMDDSKRLADLAVLAADRHHHLVAEGLVTHRGKLVPLFRAELARRPFRIWEDLIEGDLLYNGPAMVAAGVIADRAIAGPNGLLEESIIRRANAAAALFVLGHPEDAWPLLVHSPDPSVRSHLIRRLAAVGADPTLLAARYRAERDLSAKRALLLALGDIPSEKLPAKFREPLVRELLDEYADHPDPGLHSTIGWLLRQQWNEGEAIRRVDAEIRLDAEVRAALARKRVEDPVPNSPDDFVESDWKKGGWFVNAEGQEFAVVKGPVTTAFGSPIGEAGRMGEREPARRRQIDHSFAIATREVTAAEFRRFRPDHPKNPFNDDPNCPAVMITWPEAAAYCNYLSEREGIPRDQWCYELDGKGGVTIREDRLTLRGFRLPTELEWECAGRAGCVTARPFGRPGCLLSRYAWVDQNAGRNSHRGGLLRPNDWGLFDTLGNVWEWCEDAAVLDEPGRVVANYWDTGDRNQRRVYRGASFFDDTPSVRLANRNSYHPGDAYYSIGLRLVRSLP